MTCQRWPALRCHAVGDLQKARSPTQEAQATTREEFEDNLFHIVKAWRAKTTDPFWLSYDNAKIQATANITTLYHPHYPGDEEEAIQLDPDTCRLKIPPYSHDINRPIEHIFGTMKHRIREALYFEYKKYSTPKALQTMVWDLFHSHIPKKHVVRDVEGLPMLWRVLSTPYGIRFMDDDSHEAVGSGGNWPTYQYR